jgi:hypothetical protein
MKLWRELRYWFFPQKNPRPNIGMFGDGDDVELLQEVEKSYGICFSDEEAEKMRTVGDFYECAVSKASVQGREIKWVEFARVLASYGTVSAAEIDPAMEFFVNVY